MIEVAGILLVQGDEYVLQHRDDIPVIAEPGTYSLWGGMLEGDESPEQGAQRELEEETGIKIGAHDLIFLHSYVTIGRGPRSFGEPVKTHLFGAKIDTNIVVECLEGQGVIRLARYSELHEKLNEFAKEAIEIYETAAR